LLAGDVRKASRAMPEPNNFNFLILTLQPVNYAVRATNDLAKIWLMKFRHLTAKFRKIRQVFCADDQFKTKPGCCVWIMLGDVTDDV